MLKSNIRIVDIAKLAGVSVGTVDRVLHNRGRVSEKAKQKVEEVLKEINYEPNVVARLLASKKRSKIATVIPMFIEGEYWELVSRGIDDARDEFGALGLTIEYIFFNQDDEKSFGKAARTLMEGNFSGVVIATLFGKQVIELSRKLDEIEIPYVYIDSNISEQKNLAYFGADSQMSGYLGAKLLVKELATADCDIVIGSIEKAGSVKGSTQITMREGGCKDYLKEINYKQDIFSINISEDKFDESSQRLQQIINRSEKGFIGGLVFNSRIHLLNNLFGSVNTRGKTVCLVGYDPIDKNAEAMTNGYVSILISQRATQQGYDAVKIFGDLLIFGRRPTMLNHFMPIDILLEENIEYYRNYEL